MVKQLACVLIIILFLLFVSSALDRQDCGIYGLWEAELKFKESANLDSMFLLIGAPNGCAKNSIGFLGNKCMVKAIIRADDTTLSNEVVCAKLRRTSVMPCSTQQYNISFDKPINSIPKNVLLVFDPIANMIVVRDRKKIYAKLYKKPEASAFIAFGEDEGED